MLSKITLGHVYDYWQQLQINEHLLQISIKIISSENERLPGTRKNGLSFGFFVTIIVKDKFVVLYPFPVVVNC